MKLFENFRHAPPILHPLAASPVVSPAAAAHNIINTTASTERQPNPDIKQTAALQDHEISTTTMEVKAFLRTSSIIDLVRNDSVGTEVLILPNYSHGNQYDQCDDRYSYRELSKEKGDIELREVGQESSTDA